MRRAAFDIGSGKIKLQVADVDIASRRIVETLMMDTIDVPFAQSLLYSSEKKFDQMTISKAVEAINQLKSKAEEFRPEKYIAVATESFRKASNGKEAANIISTAVDVSISIISQDEEGILGFFSGIQKQNVSNEDAIVWDIGGGSVQVTTPCTTKDGLEYEFYHTDFGRVATRDMVKTSLGRELLDIEISPYSDEEINTAITYCANRLPTPSMVLIEKIKKNSGFVIGIGAHSKILLKDCRCYNYSDVYPALRSLIGQSEKDLLAVLPNSGTLAPNFVFSDLILTLVNMERLGIKHVEYSSSTLGNTSGLLVSDSYWR